MLSSPSRVQFHATAKKTVMAATEKSVHKCNVVKRFAARRQPRSKTGFRRSTTQLFIPSLPMPGAIDQWNKDLAAARARLKLLCRRSKLQKLAAWPKAEPSTKCTAARSSMTKSGRRKLNRLPNDRLDATKDAEKRAKEAKKTAEQLRMKPQGE